MVRAGRRRSRRRRPARETRSGGSVDGLEPTVTGWSRLVGDGRREPAAAAGEDDGLGRRRPRRDRSWSLDPGARPRRRRRGWPAAGGGWRRRGRSAPRRGPSPPTWSLSGEQVLQRVAGAGQAVGRGEVGGVELGGAAAPRGSRAGRRRPCAPAAAEIAPTVVRWSQSRSRPSKKPALDAGAQVDGQHDDQRLAGPASAAAARPR